MIFVTVGTSNFDFSRLLNEVDKIASKTDERIVIQKGNTQGEFQNCEVYDFIEKERFNELIRRARIVITHAGVGNLITCMNYGKKPIVVPRQKRFGEHKDNHQIEIAKKFSEKYGLPVVREIKELKNTLEDVKGTIETKAEKKLVNYLRNLLDSFNQ